jgi:hypothetical protein
MNADSRSTAVGGPDQVNPRLLGEPRADIDAAGAARPGERAREATAGAVRHCERRAHG